MIGSAQNDIANELDARIANGEISEELEPIKCSCGSVDFLDVTTSRLDNLQCEKDRFCKICKRLLGSWAYGSWLP